jgi:hypothetical protein
VLIVVVFGVEETFQFCNGSREFDPIAPCQVVSLKIRASGRMLLTDRVLDPLDINA